MKHASQLMPVVQAFQDRLGDDLIAIVLFGSQARGEATSTSDWDIFLIAHSLPVSTFQRHLYLKEIIPSDWRSLIAIIAKTPEEFESHLSVRFWQRIVGGLVGEAQNFGSMSQLVMDARSESLDLLDGFDTPQNNVRAETRQRLIPHFELVAVPLR